jgi:NADPH-dependent curcumin reductase CurA
MSNRQLLLRERPTGLVNQATTELVTTEPPTPGVDEALIRVGYLSIDPTIRTWMDDAPGYLPPIGIGDVVRGAGTGVVVESNSDRYQVGDIVFGMTGWQEWCLATKENSFSVIPGGMGLSLPTVMNVLGVTGITAWFGITDVGAIQEGDVVVISGAAGATGSVAGQVARAKGASKVIGIAGGPEKCAQVVEEFGFDACLDYKEGNLARRIRELAPKGVNLYFDNVGGEILDSVLLTMALRGRIVACGAISQYNAEGGVTGLKNTSMVIVNRLRWEGFIVLDYGHRFLEAQMELAGLVLSGALAHREHLVAGLERAPEALNMLFSGANTGKTLVVVDDSVALS